MSVWMSVFVHPEWCPILFHFSSEAHVMSPRIPSSFKMHHFCYVYARHLHTIYYSMVFKPLQQIVWKCCWPNASLKTPELRLVWTRENGAFWKWRNRHPRLPSDWLLVAWCILPWFVPFLSRDPFPSKNKRHQPPDHQGWKIISDTEIVFVSKLKHVNVNVAPCFWHSLCFKH